MNAAPEFVVKVVERAPVRGAALRLKGELTPETIGLLWGRLLLQCADMPFTGPAFGLHQDKKYAACWALPAGFPLPEGFNEADAPGGWHAVTVHLGAYDRLSDTVEKILSGWLPHSGFRRADGPIVEVYLNDPRETKEEDLQTEVCIPIQPDPIE